MMKILMPIFAQLLTVLDGEMYTGEFPHPNASYSGTTSNIPRKCIFVGIACETQKMYIFRETSLSDKINL